MHDIFISYSRKDLEFVNWLVGELSGQDLSIWVDQEGIAPTEKWMQSIYEAIEASDNFVFIISPDSLSSEYCQRELLHAIKNNKRLIPILRKAVMDNDFQVKNGFEDEEDEVILEGFVLMKSIQYIDFREQKDQNETLDSLVQSINTNPEWAKQHTRWLQRAREWEKHDFDKGRLLTASEVVLVQGWLDEAAGKVPEPTDLHRAYIKISKDYHRKRKRINLFLSLAGITAVVIISIVAYMQFMGRQEEQQKVQIERTKVVDEQSRTKSLDISSKAIEALKNGNERLALALALESTKIDNPPPGSQTTLLRILFESNIIREYFVGSYAINDFAIQEKDNLLLTGAGNFDYINVGSKNYGGSLFLWNYKTGEIIQDFSFPEISLNDFSSVPPANPDMVQSVDINSDGSLIASGGSGGTVFIWDVKSGKPISHLDDYFSVVGIRVKHVEFSSDSKYLLAYLVPSVSESGDFAGFGENPSLVVWDIEQKEVIATKPDYGYSIFGPYENTIISAKLGDGDLSVVIWDFINDQVVFRFPGYSYPFSILDESIILLLDRNYRTANLWNSDSKQISDSIPLGTDYFSIAKDNEGVVFLGDNQEIHYIEFTSRDETLLPDEDSLDIYFLKDDGYYFKIFGDGLDNENGLYQIDLLSPMQLGDYEQPAFFNEDNKIVTISNELIGKFGNPLLVTYHDIYAISNQDSRITYWDVQEETSICEMQAADMPEQALISTDRRIAITRNNTASSENSIELWDLEKCILLDKFGSDINDMALSQNGKYLVTGRGNMFRAFAEIALWDLNNLTDPIMLMGEDTYSAHNDYISAVDISPSGNYILSGSGASAIPGGGGNRDNSVRLWDARTGEELAMFLGHESGITEVYFAENEKYAISISEDNAIILWDIEVGEEVRRIESSWSPINSYNVKYDRQSNQFLSNGIVWKFPLSYNELIAWVDTRLDFPELTCTEREDFNIDPLCE